jgi:hypothetical protein
MNCQGCEYRFFQRGAFFAFVMLLALAATSARASEGARVEAALTRGPYLQMATPNSIVIVWRTEGDSVPSVRWGRSPEKLTNEVKVEQILTRVSVDVFAPEFVPRLYNIPESEEAVRRERRRSPASTVPNTHQYEASIAGLKAFTKYYYAIYDGERRLAGGDADHYFRTLPKFGKSTPARIWVVGDSGTGGLQQRKVHEAMIGRIAADKRPLDMYIHVGDMAYTDGTDIEFQKKFFDMYQTTLRNTVCWPTMGNHEGHTSRGADGTGPYYDAYVVPTKAEAGGLASSKEAYYSFDYGRIHFICLDSHDLDRKPEGDMAMWLKADLEKTKAEWLVAFWHHPPYTKGSHDSDREQQLIEMREHIMPMLEAGGVDVVLTGHSHIYERSMLMDGAYATPTVAEGVILDDGDGDPNGDGAYRKGKGLNPHEGTIQIVAGHGGTGLGRKGTMPVMKRIIVEHGSVIIDVKGNRMTGVMVNLEGEQRDLFSIVKKGSVTPQIVENPWQPEPYTPPARPAQRGEASGGGQ